MYRVEYSLSDRSIYTLHREFTTHLEMVDFMEKTPKTFPQVLFLWYGEI